MRYQGDAALLRLVEKQGGSFNIAALRDLIAGIGASAAPPIDADWPRLVVPEPSDALVAQLCALRDELAAQSAPRRDAREKLEALRAEMARDGLDGWLVPRSDEHQNEYVPASAERLAWLTGFTGSAGLAIVLSDRAAIFVDGRYTLQVAQQTDVTRFEPLGLIDPPPAIWLAGNVGQGARIGFDPWMHTAQAVESWRRALAAKGAVLAPHARNLVDAIWTDRPAAPLGPVRVHEIGFAGMASAEKRAEIAASLVRDGVAAAVLTAPDSIAWLLNIRGSDVPNTPLALAFAIVHANAGVDLYIDDRKLLPETRAHLGESVRIHPPRALIDGLRGLGPGARIRVDPAQTAFALVDALRELGAAPEEGHDPCVLPKAIKNPIEIAGTRAAHRRDGVALCRFLAWLDREAPRGALREIGVGDRLEALRRESERYRGPSFDTICGAGPNGAIVHYRATPATERALAPRELVLVDSGGQYLDGTTDVTRTIAIGAPNAEMRERFTRVLKGHVAIATARFPEGVGGERLDTLARVALWQAGLDYEHGTGHGVGSYLSVHEGPQSISGRAASGVALKPGMIVSNEPGYYKPGAYGIRIENLVLVVTRAEPGDERPMLGFETLTLAPIDRRLIEPRLLTAEERAWVDAYHARVRTEIAPLLRDAAERAWLIAATEPLDAAPAA